VSRQLKICPCLSWQRACASPPLRCLLGVGCFYCKSKAKVSLLSMLLLGLLCLLWSYLDLLCCFPCPHMLPYIAPPRQYGVLYFGVLIPMSALFSITPIEPMTVHVRTPFPHTGSSCCSPLFSAQLPLSPQEHRASQMPVVVLQVVLVALALPMPMALLRLPTLSGPCLAPLSCQWQW